MHENVFVLHEGGKNTRRRKRNKQRKLLFKKIKDLGNEILEDDVLYGVIIQAVVGTAISTVVSISIHTMFEQANARKQLNNSVNLIKE